MAEFDLKDIKSIEFNGERVDFISINGQLVWPNTMKKPQIQDISLQTINLMNSSIVYKIYNDNDFDVECQCGSLNGQLNPTIIWGEGVNIKSKSFGSISLALKKGAYFSAFRFICADTYISEIISDMSFVAKINYEFDSSGIVLMRPIEYVLTTKEQEEVYELKVGVEKGITITQWELSEGLIEVSHTEDTLEFKVLKQTKKSDLYIKIISEGESVCATPCTTNASSSLNCGTLCTTNVSNLPNCGILCLSNVSNSSICGTPCTSNASVNCGTTCTSNTSFIACLVCTSNASTIEPCVTCTTAVSSNCNVVCVSSSSSCSTCTTSSSACKICTTYSSSRLCTTELSMGLNSSGSEADEINDADIDEIYDI